MFEPHLRVQAKEEESGKELDPSFAGKPNLKRPLKGDSVPRVAGQIAEQLSSSSSLSEQVLLLS